MLIGADFLYQLTLESKIEEWPLPQCQMPLYRVPQYMHLVKIGLLTENEVCERLYGCIIANDTTRSKEEIDAVYHQALLEGLFVTKQEQSEEEDSSQRMKNRRNCTWLKGITGMAQPKTDPPNEYGK